jgi:7-keto-8-aminopelargonate synthetase-like enzyme
MSKTETFQQIRRAYVRFNGQTLSYFSGCDYFRLSSHPRIVRAVKQGLLRHGLNVSASRITTGNHELYVKLEKQIAGFFKAETALLTSTGYVTDLVVAQALSGQFSHALLDERAHVALKDAAQFLDCPVLTFKHRDMASFEVALKRCGVGARPLVLTDGMFSHDGSVAPLREYLSLLPSDGLMLVDDAHGAGVLGKTGGGAVELQGVNRQRVVQCVTLSKAFGVFGGAILCSRKLRAKLAESSAFVGSTPLPLPLANAAAEALVVVRSDKTFRPRLNANASFVKTALREAGLHLPNNPGPIIPLRFGKVGEISKLKRVLLVAKILPPLIKYPGAPVGGYFRFVISSEHTKSQLQQLIRVLTPFANIANH